MAWFRIDDKLHDHPKVRKLRGDKMAALGLWTACGSWSADNLSDGFVPREIVHRFDAEELLAKRLVEVNLWTPTEVDGEDGYQFHQWTEHQPTRAEVERRRDDARDRMRTLRAAKKGSQSVRANSERTETNACERTDLNTSDDKSGPVGQVQLYEVSNANLQVSESVRANIVRSSCDVPDPVPSRPHISTSSAKADASAKFDEWWAEYPKKVQKADARKAWDQALRKKVDPALLVQAARAHAAGWKAVNKDRQYIPYPGRWLRAEAYNDQPESNGLALVPDLPAVPEDAFADLRARADAPAAARLIGEPWFDESKPPSDPMSPEEWERHRRTEFINARELKIREALERKAG